MTLMKRLRLERGISQQALGYRGGLPAGEISRIEQRIQVPSPRQLSRIARVLKVAEAELLMEGYDYAPASASQETVRGDAYPEDHQR